MNKIINALCIIMTLFTISATTTGCVALSRHEISRPTSETPDITISKIGRMEIADTIIFISSANAVLIESGTSWVGIPFWDKIDSDKQVFSWAYYRREKEPGFFILELFIAPQDTPVSFFPQDVLLTYRDRKYQPSSTYSLIKQYDSMNPWWGHNLRGPLCTSPEKKFHYTDNDRRMIKSESGIKIKRPSVGTAKALLLEANTKHCFAIEYDLNPPDPREEFIVEFDILINSQRFPIRIKFIPETVSDQHAMLIITNDVISNKSSNLISAYNAPPS